jgi:hypothetical protein
MQATPPEPTLPAIISRGPGDFGDFVHGIATPGWRLEQCIARSNGNFGNYLYSDALGGFWASVPTNEPMLLRYSGVQTPGVEPLSGPCGPAGAYQRYELAMPNAQSGAANEAVFHRWLSISVGSGTSDVEIRVRLPSGTALSAWASTNKLGPLELGQHLFGLQLLQEDEFGSFESYSEPIWDRLLVDNVDPQTDEISARFTVSTTRIRIDRALSNAFPDLMSLPTDDVTIVAPVSLPVKYTSPPARESPSPEDHTRTLRWNRSLARFQRFNIEIGAPERQPGPESVQQKAGAQASQRSPLGAVDRLRSILPGLVSTVGF